MRDPRIDRLADVLVNYSVKCKKGEKVFIDLYDTDAEIGCALVEKAEAAGGLPYVKINSTKVRRAMLMGTNEEHLNALAKYEAFIMNDMDCYIAVRGAENSFEYSDVPEENMAAEARLFSYPVHHEIRVKKTRWVVLRYPLPSMAQAAGMSTAAFEKFFFDVCTLDYAKMDRAMDALKARMERTDKVRLVAKGTDLTFSIRGIPAVKCAGELNIPDGEVYTAPVRESVNGVITYNAPSLKNGIKHENIRFVFKDGKIVEATSSDPAALNAVLDTDAGARYVGEFAIGVNPFINEPMLDTLFDEKIAGSIHFTPGCCYDDAYNGNQSGVHWDLVLIMTEKYGGGEIYFDGELIRKDGRFVTDDLLCLNPEALK